MKIPSRFLREVAALGLAQVIVGLCSVALIAVLAARLTADGLGLFYLSRRSIALAGPIILLGFDVALPRYIGLHRDRAAAYLTVALIASGSLGIVTLLAAVCFAPAGAVVVFGTASEALLLMAVAAHWLTYPLQAILYAFYRGLRSIRMVTGVWIAYALFPLALALFIVPMGGTDSMRLGRFFLATAVFTLALAVVARSAAARPWSWDRAALRELLRYGIPRIPSSFFLAATYAAPVLFAAHFIGLSAAAVQGTSIAVLPVLEQLATPVSLVLLPQVAEFVGDPSRAGLRLVGATVVPFALHCGLAAAFLLPGVIPDLLVLWVGREKTSVAVAAVVAFGAGWDLAYVILRGVLDAITPRPLITYITLVTAALAAGLGWGLGRAFGGVGLGIAVSVSLTWLGVACVWCGFRYLRARISRPDAVFALLIVTLAVGVSAGDWALWRWAPGLIVTLALKLALRGACLLALAGAARRLRLAWWQALAERLRRRSPDQPLAAP